MMTNHILIVEDEKDLAAILEYNLQAEGYKTTSATSGRAAMQTLRQSPLPNLVLLDLMLPDASGIDICRQIKQDEKTRDLLVVMLTAKGEEIDRVVGFEVGADDYVVKPFSVRELMLRIKAILKRKQMKPPENVETLQFGDLRIDLPAHRAWVKDREIVLTALEFRLLTTLLSRKGRVQSRDTLLSDVWGIDADVTTRTVDTHIKRLREKLQTAGEYIETLRGVGYRFLSEPTGDNH